MKGKNIAILGIVGIIIAVFITWGAVYATTVGTGTMSKELNIDGSTTCQPIITAAAAEFVALYPDWTITVGSGGSSVGVAHVTEGITDIGMASRAVKSSEFEEHPELRDFAFAADGIAVVFSADATHGVTDLTMEQVVKIYEGEYTDWSQVGGSAGTIVVNNRDSASGTRASFEEITGLEDSEAYDTAKATFTEHNSNGAMHDAVAGNPNAIGYVGLGYLSDEVIALKIGGIEANAENIKAGDYPISRLLHLVTNGAPTPQALAFLQFVYGPLGQKLVEDEGFIPLYDLGDPDAGDYDVIPDPVTA